MQSFYANNIQNEISFQSSTYDISILNVWSITDKSDQSKVDAIKIFNTPFDEMRK